MPDCGNCPGGMVCMKKKDMATVKAQGFQPMTISRNSWYDLVDAVHRRGPLSIWRAVLLWRVCITSLITPLSWSVWTVYQACDGLKRIQTPQQFFDLPSLYVDACNVIDSELALTRRGQHGTP